jgi:hypothetical protein
MPHRIHVAIVLGLLAIGGIANAPAAAEKRELQATMDALFESITDAYLLILQPVAFQDPANHEHILLELRQISANADRLDKHAGGLNDSYGYLRRSFASDARDAARRFEQQQYVGTRFLLEKMTENCVACHLRLPAEHDFALGKRLVSNPQIANLRPEERMRVEIAARQFDDAMATCESIFASKSLTADQIEVTGTIEDYLKLCLGVRGDTARPAATFRTMAQRADMPGYLKSDLDAWVKALEKLNLIQKGKELETARELITEAQTENRFPADRKGLVNFVAATRFLSEYLDTRPNDAEKRADAYYMLGVAESYISRSYWVSDTDFLLESAIRTAPHTPVAERAFVFLEKYVTLGYSGSSGVDVPDDVQDRLDALRKLAVAR